eukprot:CAMPEP_0170369604 /NCGR_PEP_ID=MMETSP0117_2-20130122/8070_1 /TAXON_ID=400756 /ORGANISM="Durinskia baltica, Strain CSIRO CS-38" /LENGTH=196 /DNA_ID=CAMNT_0010624331 /DNA_START=62 /DNA_END=652 /DNA_ORIENTATION=+
MEKKRDDIIGSGRHKSVDQLLDSYHRAAAKADLVAYFGCMDKQGRYLGTDASENWSSTEFYDFCKPYFATGRGWTYIPIPKSRKVTYFPGPTSEGAVFCTFDELLHNDSFGSCRGSGSLIYSTEFDCWFIAAYHLTFPVPNDIADEITDRIKSEDGTLLASKADAAAAELLAELELEEAQGGSKTAKGNKKKKGGK